MKILREAKFVSGSAAIRCWYGVRQMSMSLELRFGEQLDSRADILRRERSSLGLTCYPFNKRNLVRRHDAIQQQSVGAAQLGQVPAASSISRRAGGLVLITAVVCRTCTPSPG